MKNKKIGFKIMRLMVKRFFSHPSLNIFISKRFTGTYLKLFYFNWVGKWPNLKKPKDLNELLVVYSIKNKGNKLLIDCTDKYNVRQYISDCGFKDTLNELYGVYDNVEAIDFEALPDQFVMKMNNASARNLICTDKSTLDIPKIKEEFAAWLKDTEFGLLSGEWQYSMIEPKIVIEKYLANLGEDSLIDYKFHCSKGKVHSCFVAYNRSATDSHGKVCYDHYTLNWERTDDILPQWHLTRKLIPKPANYDFMIEMASKLSEPFDYVRVDFYNIEGKILFGELTFTPQGCVQEFYQQDFLENSLSFFQH